MIITTKVWRKWITPSHFDFDFKLTSNLKTFCKSSQSKSFEVKSTHFCRPICYQFYNWSLNDQSRSQSCAFVQNLWQMISFFLSLFFYFYLQTMMVSHILFAFVKHVLIKRSLVLLQEELFPICIQLLSQGTKCFPSTKPKAF